LTAAAKQLVNVKQEKEKIQEQVRKRDITKNSEVRDMSAPTARQESCTDLTLLWVHGLSLRE